MRLSFGNELRATGLAGPDDPVEEVHRIEGPITITGYLRIGGRLAWIEHDRDQRLAEGDVDRALTAIRTVAGTDAWPSSRWSAATVPRCSTTWSASASWSTSCCPENRSTPTRARR